ncbi:MAG: hypothetical protein ACLU9S_20580 [Oscillospiraceae bacterium]
MRWLLGARAGEAPITEGYRIRLQEALEHFDVYIQQLAELLEPVAQYLTPFLDLWAAKSEPLFQEWEAYFAQQDLKKWLKNRCQLYVNNGCEVLQIVPRYIGAGTAHYEMDEAEHVVSLQIGVGFAIRKAPKTGLEDWSCLLRAAGGAGEDQDDCGPAGTANVHPGNGPGVGPALGHRRPGREQLDGCPPAFGRAE